MAGESAREVARRRREKGERLQRSAEMFERGAHGEQATADALSALPGEQWTCFHDVRWPGRRYANVDHVVVGPPGVFVIDSKNWSGSITVRDDVLRQNGRLREREVAATAESALAVAGLVPLLRPDLVKPLLCFTRTEPIAGWARDVMICSTANVAEMLLSRPAVLETEQLRSLTLDVDAGLRAAALATEQSARRAPAASPPRLPSSGLTSKPRPRARARRVSRGETVKVVLVVGLMLAVLTQPGLVSGVTTAFVRWLGDGITSVEPTEPTQKPKPGKRAPDDREKQGSGSAP